MGVTSDQKSGLILPEAPAQATPPKPAAMQPASAPAQSAPARPATAPWNRKS